jgi:hypothetical protein
MNPFVNNVVDEMGRKQQQDIQRNVLPGLAASSAATGNFGSKRMAMATGQTLSDMQANLTGQQYGALNTGYQNAMQSAQADLNRQLQAGQGMSNVAQQQYQIGSGGLNTLSSLGSLQQAQGQRQLDYPMVQAQNYANLLQGLNIPTGQVQQTVAPGQQGQYTNSPLSQIAGIGSLLAAISGTGATNSTSIVNDLINAIRGTSSTPAATPPATGKEGGSVVGYADGGTVDPIDMQGMTKPYDLSQAGKAPPPGMPLYQNPNPGTYGAVNNNGVTAQTPMPGQGGTEMFENNPVDPIMYTGGTPNFDETTGEYINPEVKPLNPEVTDMPVAMPTEAPTDMPVRNTNTPLPYERTTTATQPKGALPQITLPSHYQSPFSSYGFSPELQSYLDQNNYRSTFDAGVGYQYDPATQTFTGGTMSGRYNPIPLSVMQEAAGGNRDALSPYFQFKYPEMAIQPPSRDIITKMRERDGDRAPLKIKDFTNMNPAPRDLIKNLDRVRSRPARIQRPQRPRMPFSVLNFMNRGKR